MHLFQDGHPSSRMVTFLQFFPASLGPVEPMRWRLQDRIWRHGSDFNRWASRRGAIYDDDWRGWIPEAPKSLEKGGSQWRKRGSNPLFPTPPPFGRKAGKFLHLATKILSFFFFGFPSSSLCFGGCSQWWGCCVEVVNWIFKLADFSLRSNEASWHNVESVYPYPRSLWFI